MWLRRVATVATLLGLLAGCSSPEGDEPRAGDGSSSAASTSPSPAADSTGPPPTDGAVHAVGDRVRLATGSTVTVFSWERVERPGRPAQGAWWDADVKICLTSGLGDLEEPVGNMLSTVRLELVDERALKPEDDARQADEVYAQPGGTIASGQCRRGKMVFDVPATPAAQYFSVTISPFSWVRWQVS